jgi:hypothetical protein
MIMTMADATPADATWLTAYVAGRDVPCPAPSSGAPARARIHCAARQPPPSQPQRE